MAEPTGNCFVDSLETADRAAMAPLLRSVDLEPGQVVIKQEGEVAWVHFPIKAQFTNVVRLEDGEGVSTALVGREGISGLAAFMAAEPCGWDVIVRAAGSALVALASDLRVVTDASPSLRGRMLALTHLYQIQGAHNVACVSQHRSLQRVARWLLTAADFTADDTVRVTQEELSHLVSTRRTTVVEVAQRLREIGAVKYLRGVVRIVDRPKLERVACECYQVLRARARREGFLSA